MLHPLGIWLTAVGSKYKSGRLLPVSVCHCHSCSGALKGNLLSGDLKGAVASAGQHVVGLSIDKRDEEHGGILWSGSFLLFVAHDVLHPVLLLASARPLALWFFFFQCHLIKKTQVDSLISSRISSDTWGQSSNAASPFCQLI